MNVDRELTDAYRPWLSYQGEMAPVPVIAAVDHLVMGQEVLASLAFRTRSNGGQGTCWHVSILTARGLIAQVTVERDTDTDWVLSSHRQGHSRFSGVVRHMADLASINLASLTNYDQAQPEHASQASFVLVFSDGSRLDLPGQDAPHRAKEGATEFVGAVREIWSR